MFKKIINKTTQASFKKNAGRPKLASKALIKAARIETVLALILCATIIFSGTGVLTGKTALELLGINSKIEYKGIVTKDTGKIATTKTTVKSTLGYQACTIKLLDNPYGFSVGSNSIRIKYNVTCNNVKIYKIQYRLQNVYSWQNRTDSNALRTGNNSILIYNKYPKNKFYMRVCFGSASRCSKEVYMGYIGNGSATSSVKNDCYFTNVVNPQGTVKTPTKCTTLSYNIVCKGNAKVSRVQYRIQNKFTWVNRASSSFKTGQSTLKMCDNKNIGDLYLRVCWNNNNSCSADQYFGKINTSLK